MHPGAIANKCFIFINHAVVIDVKRIESVWKILSRIGWGWIWCSGYPSSTTPLTTVLKRELKQNFQFDASELFKHSGGLRVLHVVRASLPPHDEKVVSSFNV